MLLLWLLGYSDRIPQISVEKRLGKSAPRARPVEEDRRAHGGPRRTLPQRDPALPRHAAQVEGRLGRRDINFTSLRHQL